MRWCTLKRNLSPTEDKLEKPDEAVGPPEEGNLPDWETPRLKKAAVNAETLGGITGGVDGTGQS
jgi:hypothetical protein